MKKSLLLLLVLALALGVYTLLPKTGRQAETRRVEGLPWQIEALPQGTSRVFGITLGESTLGEVRQRLGEDMDLAIIVRSDDDRALEMYYKYYTAGLFKGKLVIVADLPDDILSQMLQRSPGGEYMKSGARKFRVAPGDLRLAWEAPVSSITFLPSSRLDRETARARFGNPEETIKDGETVTHLLYPAKGLDLIMDRKGKTVLQYVAPRDFERLRAPLLAPRGG
ncbi:MAG TPA: hypothetical protein ENK05_12410 [Gammaproteobacteria bacterium]|nr:hypothetical protein [Gammaproteobacteria bacterium]